MTQHAAPDIDIDGDDARPLAQSVAKKSAARKNKKGVKPIAPKPAQIVADSESESDVASSNDEDSGSNSPSEDDLVNEEELIAERPKVVSIASKQKHSKAAEKDGYESYELDDVSAIRRNQSKGKAPRAAESLFDSEDESGSDESMLDAPPRNTDADIEMAEKIQDFLVHVPPVGRHRRTVSASSGSSGRATSVPDSEVEIHEIDDSESDDGAAAHKKPRQVSAARRRQADSEKPSVRRSSASTDAPSGTDVYDRTEASWHVTARLVYPAPNRDLGLNAQPAELQFVLRSSIGSVRHDLLFHDSYPTISTRAGFARPHLIKGALIRVSSRHIHERLLKDPSFAAALAPIPLDRINIGLVDLEVAEVKARVETLLKDHRYIFPADKKNGQLKLDQPFCHGAIPFVIKEVFFSKPSFLTQNIEHFPRNPKNPAEIYLPLPLIALPTTAVYASLVEYRMSGTRQPAPFTEDAFEDIYRNHIATLEQNLASAPKSTHKLLHNLFKQVTAHRSVSEHATGSSSTLIQLVDVPSD
ncbi:hypothetical protein K438DRAFT_1983293 [Mycena galopus ATCC 62051]|nr:hypothetical protein K438DRAFT_1983293 [Mycena galopus ATCC 62051]